MRIAIEGCAHGELETIYATIAALDRQRPAGQPPIRLLLCCGDFQATRNAADLLCAAIPRKYHAMGSFHKYYSGQLLAPLLTIVIGGNHEASNHMQELPYGGWLAPNIYYLGAAGVVRVGNCRVAGLSGIYKAYNYHRGAHETAPYGPDELKSVYHVRQLQVFRLRQLSGAIDVCLSHDWPRGVHRYGDAAQLGRFKPHFVEEMADNRLGSPAGEELLRRLRPAHWFAAHLHCKFAAVVAHGAEEEAGAEAEVGDEDRRRPAVTRFLALDKCLPRRRFLQVLEIGTEVEAEADEASEAPPVLSYDLEWLAILRSTNHLLSVKPTVHYMPGPGGAERHNYTPTAAELAATRHRMAGDLRVPHNFQRTAPVHQPPTGAASASHHQHQHQQPAATWNPQTAQLCEQLGIDDPVSLLMAMRGQPLRPPTASATATGQPLTDELTLDDQLNPDGDCIEPPVAGRGAFVLPEPIGASGPESCAEPLRDQLSEAEHSDRLGGAEDGLGEGPQPSLADSTEEGGAVAAVATVADEPEVQPKRFKRRNEAIYAAAPAECDD